MVMKVTNIYKHEIVDTRAQKYAKFADMRHIFRKMRLILKKTNKIIWLSLHFSLFLKWESFWKWMLILVPAIYWSNTILSNIELQ